MRRSRQLALILMSLGIVVGVVYGTGAFDSAVIQRQASVQVTGDSSSYLALSPADGPNGAYASQQSGQLRISLSANGETAGTGVNPDSETTFANVFTITNRGSTPVGVWLTDESDRVTFETEDGPIEQPEQAIRLEPGQQQEVTIHVDTRGYTGDTKALISSITVHGSSNISGLDKAEETRGSAGDRSRGVDAGLSTEAGDPTTKPPKRGGPPEFTEDMKTRMENLHSELTDKPEESDAGIEETLTNAVVATTATVSRTLPGNSEKYVFRGGTWIVRGATTVLASGIMLLTHGSQPAGGPATTNGALTTLAVYPPGTTAEHFDSPLRLPTGAGGYETSSGNERIFGVEQLTQLSGLTRKNVPQAVGEILKQPVEVHSEDGYTVVVGDNPHGTGEITLWLYEGYVVKGTTEEMEEVENHEPNQYEQDQQQTNEDDQRKTPQRNIHNGTRLLPDGGGTLNDHQAMNELRKKGVSQETIIEWSNQGYNVQGLNEALGQYQNSGKQLSNSKSGAQGELGEIVAKNVITDMYPASKGYEYIQEMKLRNKNNRDIIEIDWVVVDEDNKVVATYQVKSGKGKHNDAQRQIEREKNAFSNDSVSHLKNSQGVSVSDFESNLKNIDRYTVGPQDDPRYDNKFELSSEELDALLELIRNNNP